MENFPQGLVPPTSHLVSSFAAFKTVFEPRSQHGVVVHTWRWYLPTGRLEFVIAKNIINNITKMAYQLIYCSTH